MGRALAIRSGQWDCEPSTELGRAIRSFVVQLVTGIKNAEISS